LAMVVVSEVRVAEEFLMPPWSEIGLPKTHMR